MKKLRFLVSLTTSDNDYQQEQAATAAEAARRLGVDVRVIYAENDAITQSQQLLEVIQSRSDSTPDAVICHPVGTGLVQVAHAAAEAGIGWVLLNRDADYIPQLRKSYGIPVFNVNVDQEQVGRIQGQQIAALLPGSGLVLYIVGPAVSPAVQQRAAGMNATKPENVQVRTVRGRWTEDSGYDAIRSWLRLSTSQTTPVNLVASQNDNMAIGARKAFLDEASDPDRKRWLSTPFIGCDASRQAGQEWVRKGLLTASIVLPPSAGLAVEMLVRYFQTGTVPTENTLLSPESFPPVELLVPAKEIGGKRGPAK